MALAAPLTNALACLWGAVAAYILCYSSLITHNLWFAIAALSAIIAVWATLERKRWGRMALLGLSLTTVGVFVFLVSAFAAFPDHVEPEVQSLDNYLRSLASLYDIKTPAAIGLVVLAAVTGPWMLHSHVITEFNRNKKPGLAAGQRVIAIALVCCWAAAIVRMPLLTAESQNGSRRGHMLTARNQAETLGNRSLRARPRVYSPSLIIDHAPNSLPVLSAAPVNNR